MSRKPVERNCETCGDAFLFSGADQERYAQSEWAPPRRCEGCRDARRQAKRPEPPQADGFEAVCSACGALTYVQFKPTESRPIYCSACFRNR